MRRWKRISWLFIKNRNSLFAILALLTLGMLYFATKVELNYEMNKTSLPENNPVAQTYAEFQKTFSEKPVILIGFQKKDLFSIENFNLLKSFTEELKACKGVEGVLNITNIVDLKKDPIAETFRAEKIFADSIKTNQDILNCYQHLKNTPFYHGLIYNEHTNVVLTLVNINEKAFTTKKRINIIEDIEEVIHNFSEKIGTDVYISGLPYTKTKMGVRIQQEMVFLILISAATAFLILSFFFKSWKIGFLSLLIVAVGIIWSLGLMFLLGYKISLLTALVPPLIVVIGIPNSIYIIHKYHTAYEEIKIKKHALRIALEQMGIVTFMCNLTTAIGFLIFAFTPSPLLQEFGLVSGISILLLFPISIILILIFMSFMPPPHSKKKSYLHTNIFNKLIAQIIYLIEYKEKWIYIFSSMVFIITIVGIMKVKSNSYLLDDLPKNEKVYNDLMFFDQNFGGVLPLEIIINTNKKNGAMNMGKLMQVDELVRYVDSIPDVGQSLSIIRGLYFIRQAYYNSPNYYSLPNTFDFAFIQPYLRKKNDDKQVGNSLLFNKLLNQYVDSNKQQLRVSIMMKDIGTKRLDSFIHTLNKKIINTFDTAQTPIVLSGTNILFQASNQYLLKEMGMTILWAFLLVSLCVFVICRNIKITLLAIIPNVLSLMVVFALMGFLGIELKPANAIIFSIVYGISIDLTLRLIMAYLYENEAIDNAHRWKIVLQKTALSIVFTALVLVGGFLVFCTSQLSNVFALGGLTASVLIVSALSNLLVFGALLKHISIRKK